MSEQEHNSSSEEHEHAASPEAEAIIESNQEASSNPHEVVDTYTNEYERSIGRGMNKEFAHEQALGAVQEEKDQQLADQPLDSDEVM